MPKLLIADPSCECCDSIRESLRKEWEIYTCTDSYPIIDTIRYLNPDAMLINLDIGPKDGIAVLQESFPNLPPVILALTSFKSPYIADTAESLGVSDLIQTPCEAAHIKNRLLDVYQAYLTKPSLLTRHLDSLGINSSLAGYRCLLVGITFLKRNPNFLLKEIYPEIAKLVGLTDSRNTEHCIRTAIRNAWKSRSPEVWNYYFPGQSKCPSNKTFITRIAQLI